MQRLHVKLRKDILYKNEFHLKLKIVKITMYLGSLNQIPRISEIKGPNVFGQFPRKVATVQHYGYFKHGPANMILHRSARFGKLGPGIWHRKSLC